MVLGSVLARALFNSGEIERFILLAGVFAGVAEEDSKWVSLAHRRGSGCTVDTGKPFCTGRMIGNGTNTVSATSFLGAASAPSPPYPNTIDYVNSMGMTTDTPPPTIPVTFVEDALSLTTIAVGDTQITITNNAPSGTAVLPGGAPMQ